MSYFPAGLLLNHWPLQLPSAWWPRAVPRKLPGRLPLERVTRVAIHPAIGLARVGNSPDAFFFAPEVPGATPRGPFKDANGAVAKQAARFRLYGYDQDGRVVGELTADLAEIRLEVSWAEPSTEPPLKRMSCDTLWHWQLLS